MPKIDIAKAVVRTKGVYPSPYRSVTDGREKAALGNVARLTQFGVNLTRLKPGAASALRHWHEQEDEFIDVLDGELVLVEDGGETLLGPGDCAGFKAGVSNGHQLVNKVATRRALSRTACARRPSARIIPMSIWSWSATRTARAFCTNPASRIRRSPEPCIWSIQLDTDADGIALVTWDLPGRSMNVIDLKVMEELASIIETVAGDAAIKGAVITSGKDTFCAGADLTMLEMLSREFTDVMREQGEEMGVQRLFEEGRRLSQTSSWLETSGKPWVAAINGMTLGGGFSIHVVSLSEYINIAWPSVEKKKTKRRIASHRSAAYCP